MNNLINEFFILKQANRESELLKQAFYIYVFIFEI